MAYKASPSTKKGTAAKGVGGKKSPKNKMINKLPSTKMNHKGGNC